MGYSCATAFTSKYSVNPIAAPGRSGGSWGRKLIASSWRASAIRRRSRSKRIPPKKQATASVRMSNARMVNWGRRIRFVFPRAPQAELKSAWHYGAYFALIALRPSGRAFTCFVDASFSARRRNINSSLCAISAALRRSLTNRTPPKKQATVSIRMSNPRMVN